MPQDAQRKELDLRAPVSKQRAKKFNLEEELKVRLAGLLGVPCLLLRLGLLGMPRACCGCWAGSSRLPSQLEASSAVCMPCGMA